MQACPEVKPDRVAAKPPLVGAPEDTEAEAGVEAPRGPERRPEPTMSNLRSRPCRPVRR